MDILTKNEIDGLKGDIEASNIDLENNMNDFANKLINGLGEKIENDLENKNLNVVRKGIIYRLKKWAKDRKEKKELKKYLDKNGTEI